MGVPLYSRWRWSELSLVFFSFSPELGGNLSSFFLLLGGTPRLSASSPSPCNIERLHYLEYIRTSPSQLAGDRSRPPPLMKGVSGPFLSPCNRSFSPSLSVTSPFLLPGKRSQDFPQLGFCRMLKNSVPFSPPCPVESFSFFPLLRGVFSCSFVLFNLSPATSFLPLGQILFLQISFPS